MLTIPQKSFLLFAVLLGVALTLHLANYSLLSASLSQYFFSRNPDRISIGTPLTSEPPMALYDYGSGSSNNDALFLLPVHDNVPRPLRNTAVGDFSPNSRAVALFDLKNGRYLFSQNIDQPLPIASVTKLMAAMVILDHVSLDEQIPVKPEYIDVDGERADLFKGETLSAQSLITIMLVNSSNDAALAFNGYLKDKGIDLVEEMNRNALKLGMQQTHFLDPAGLNDDGFSTARDVIRMAQEVDRYPIIWSTLRMPAAKVYSVDKKIAHNLKNTNQLLGLISGIVGGKTGNTPKAKGSLVLVIERHGTELVSVIIGSDDRFGQTKQLIDWSDNAYLW